MYCYRLFPRRTILPMPCRRGYKGRMTESHIVHKAEQDIDSTANFEIWPFTLDTGCPVSDVAEPHLHDYFVVHYVEDGAGTCVIDFKPYDIVPNTLYFVSPQQLHM